MLNATAAVSVLVLQRFCSGQVDVPARHAYVAAGVACDERFAAGGITNIVRSLVLHLTVVLPFW